MVFLLVVLICSIQILSNGQQAGCKFASTKVFSYVILIGWWNMMALIWGKMDVYKQCKGPLPLKSSLVANLKTNNEWWVNILWDACHLLVISLIAFHLGNLPKNQSMRQRPSVSSIKSLSSMVSMTWSTCFCISLRVVSSKHILFFVNKSAH